MIKQTKTKNKNDNLYDDSDDFLLILKKAVLVGNVVKGIKETIKAIEHNNCNVVYLATDCEDLTYKKCIKDFCEMYLVKLVEKYNNLQIRDAVMIGDSSYNIIKTANYKGKQPRIMPKCYCAAILEDGNLNKTLNKTV